MLDRLLAFGGGPGVLEGVFEGLGWDWCDCQGTDWEARILAGEWKGGWI